MTRIQLDNEQINQINTLGKSFLDPKHHNFILKHLRLTIEGDNLKVEALDGTKYVKYETRIYNTNNVNGELYIQPIGKNYLKKHDIIFIEEKEGTIEIYDAKMQDIRTQAKTKPLTKYYEGDLLNIDAKLEVTIDPRRLIKVLQGFNNDEFITLQMGEFPQPIKATNDKGIEAVLLPCRKGE